QEAAARQPLTQRNLHVTHVEHRTISLGRGRSRVVRGAAGAAPARILWDYITNFIRDIEKAAVHELAVWVLAVIAILPHLKHDVVGARRGVGVLVAGFGAGGRRRDDLAVAADLPLEA